MSDVSAGLAKLASHYLHESVAYRRAAHVLAKALTAIPPGALPPPLADQVAAALRDYQRAIIRAENSQTPAA